MQYCLLKPTLETGTLKDVIPLVAISSNKWFFTFLISAIRWSLSLQFVDHGGVIVAVKKYGLVETLQ